MTCGSGPEVDVVSITSLLPGRSNYHQAPDSQEFRMRNSSVMQNITSDILREIFSYCLPSDFSEPLSRVAPFNFSTVCRSWREFVLNTPSLWASLELSVYHQRCRDEVINAHLPCADPIHTNCSKILYAWELWLELSFNCPLDITLDIAMARAPTAIAQIIRMSFQHQRRWRTFCVDCQVTILNPVITSITYSFDLPSRFEELNIRIVNGNYHAFCGGRYRLDLRSANHVRKLIIPNARTIVSLPVARMESLTELNIYEIDMAALPYILMSAPNLATILVGLRGDIYERDMSRIVLNKLGCLHVFMHRDNMTSLSQLLSLLLTPSLKDLRLLCRFKEELPESNLWATLREFLERSCPPVEALELNSRGGRYNLGHRVASKTTSDEALIGILEGLPGLKRLHIQGSIVTSRLLSALTRDRSETSGGVLCPLLHDFPRQGDQDVLDLYQDKRKLTSLEE